MLISLSDTFARLVDATGEESGWLWGYLSIPSTREDEKPTRLLRQRVFGAGLLPLVKMGAAKRGFDVQVVDARSAPLAEPDWDRFSAPPWTFRGYQRAAMEAWWKGTGTCPVSTVHHPLPGRGIIWIPTGGGKGRLAAAFYDMVRAPTLFVVHRGHLAQTVAEDYEKFTGRTAGFIGDGRWEVTDHLTVASLQTLHARLGSSDWDKLAEQTRAYAIDECHVAAARTAYEVQMSLENARYRLGLSGSPLDRTDQKSLVAVACLGPVVYRVPAEELIAAGVLAYPTVYVVPVEQSYKFTGPPNWHEVEKALITDSVARNNAVLACMKHAMANDTAPGMVFVRKLKHARTLAKLAAAEGINVHVVDGRSSLDQRKQAIKALERGHYDFLIPTKVFTEGVNVPCLRSVINAAGGKSVIDTLQQAGRALRTTANKTSASIYEIGDKGVAMLNRHARKRIAAYQREGYPLQVLDLLRNPVKE